MATNPNLTFPDYDDWVAGGTYQVNIATGKHSRQTGEEGHTGKNSPLDPNDKNMQGYYENYKTAIQSAFDKNEPDLAKAIATSHGQSWTDPVVAETTTAATTATTATTAATETTAGTTTSGPGITTGVVKQVAAPVVEAPVVEAFDMAKLTDSTDLTNKLQEIISKNSPLFKAATTKAMQNMQRRGLVNSTLAQEAVMNAVLNVALPIAQAEVDQLVQNLYYNTDWTNKQKAQANEAAYNKMLTQLQGSINFTLQKLTGSQNIGLQNLKGQQATDLQTLMGTQAQDLQALKGTQATGLQELVGTQETKLQQDKIKADLWSKYGDWVTKMATVEGADQEAWQRMLDMLEGAGGWPEPT